MKRYGGRTDKALGWYGGFKKIIVIMKLIRKGWRETSWRVKRGDYC